MGRRAMTDLGEAGTTRLHRQMRLGLTQRELADQGGLTQPDISAFENAKRPLTRGMARRMGRALFPREHARDPIEAEQRAWGQWFRNAECYGTHAVQRWAVQAQEKIATVMGWRLPLWDHTRDAPAQITEMPPAPGEAKQA